MSSELLLPLPPKPSITLRSPFVVQVLDDIRLPIDDDALAEFAWFIREYPRIYRHHFDHAEWRLLEIYRKYELMHREYSGKPIGGLWSVMNENTSRVYWDFEAFLNGVGAALDILARVVGTAYTEQTSPSFSKLCKKTHLSGYADTMRHARDRWVNRMKDYRDCFVHYTCVDTMLHFHFDRSARGVVLRCRIPTNPNVRDLMRFRFSRRSDVLRYTISVFRNLRALDRAIAIQIKRNFKTGEYPKRINNLFVLGQRE